MGINFKIVCHIATLSTYLDVDGIRWNTELNIISWNNKAPEYDIRTWNESHTSCHYGVKLSAEEIDNLVDGMKQYYQEIA